MLEVIQLFDEREDLGGLGLGELEFERQFIVRRFAVFHVAALLHRHLHVGGDAIGKGLGVKEALRILCEQSSPRRTE